MFPLFCAEANSKRIVAVRNRIYECWAGPMREIPLNLIHIHPCMGIGAHGQDFRLKEARNLLKTWIAKVFHDNLAVSFQQKLHEKMNALLRTMR